MTASITEFFRAWSPDSADDRLAAVTASMTSDASYGDPRTPAPISGHEAIADYVGMFSQAAPGAVADVVAEQTQHGLTRATVAFKMPNGMEQTGQYFVECDASGLISKMTGFVGIGEPV